MDKGVVLHDRQKSFLDNMRTDMDKKSEEIHVEIMGHDITLYFEDGKFESMVPGLFVIFVNERPHIRDFIKLCGVLDDLIGQVEDNYE